MADSLLWVTGGELQRALSPEVRTFLNISNVENVALSSRSILAGNGMTGGGTLAADRTITLGTPTTLTGTTTNSVTSTSHTHAVQLTYSPAAVADLPSTYPINPTIGSAGTGFPASLGTVLTAQAAADTRVFQLFAPVKGGSSIPELYVRAHHTTDGSGGWTAFAKIWHDLNDGAASGLDADLLDGQQGSYYLAAANTTGYFTNGIGIDGAAATARRMQIRTAGVMRWDFGGDGTAESGSNVGTNFVVNHYDDSGVSLGTAINLERDTGAMTVKTLTITGAASGTMMASPTWQWRTETGVRRWRMQFSANDSTDGPLNFDKWNGSAWANKMRFTTADVLEITGTVTATTFTGALVGNASTATSAATLTTARTIAISGAATGTATSFNGSANISIPITAIDLTHSGLSGVVGTDHLGTGTANSTTFLRGDGTWASPTASAAWGSITGTLSAQTDLQDALNLKANLASPTFSGTASFAAITANNGITSQKSGTGISVKNSTGANSMDLGHGFSSDTDGNSWIYNRANGDLIFGTNNIEKLRIQSAGTMVLATGLSLGGTAGNSQNLCEVNGNTANAMRLVTRLVRRSNGSDWTTAALELRTRVDATDHTFIRMGGNSGNAIILGDGTTERYTFTPTSLTTSGDITVGSGASNIFFGATSTRQMINLWSTLYGIGIQNNTMYFRSANRFSWHKGGVHDTAENTPGTGGVVSMTLTNAGSLAVYPTSASPSAPDFMGLIASGSWGGGLCLQDGTARVAMYTSAGTNIHLAIGTASGVTTYLQVTTTGTAATGYLSATDRIFVGYDSGVTGSVSCSSWFRSSGNTGWYNSTHTGGIWMQDSTYVRVYNSKIFWAGAAGGSAGDIRVESTNPTIMFYDTDQATSHWLHCNSNQFGFLQSNSFAWGAYRDASNNWGCVGNITAYASDGRLKTNIVDVPKDIVEHYFSTVRIRQFDWDKSKLDQYKIGFEAKSGEVGAIAQEMMDAFADAVRVNSAHNPIPTKENPTPPKYDILTIDWTKTIPLLTAEVQRLRNRVAELEKRL